MTREEVVKDLGVIKDFFAENSGAIPLSIECAIKVLGQEPCEDVVSRKAVVEWLMTASDDSIEEAIDTNLRFLKSSTIFFPAPKAESCVSIPKGATNGDVLKMLFQVIAQTDKEHIDIKVGGDWWNAPYKEREVTK